MFCECVHCSQWSHFLESIKPSIFSTVRFKAVPLLRFFYVSALWCHMWLLLGHCLLLIISSFGVSRRLFFWIVAFPWYLHVLFHCVILSKVRFSYVVARLIIVRSD